MFLEIFTQILSNLFYLALHVTNSGSFPPPLSSKREAELLKLKEQGDINAKNELIEHNLRLVAHVVKKYYTADDQDDLISIGTIGLIKAINTFKCDKKIRLATYAARCIENEILMHFRNNKKRNKDISINESIGFDKEGNEITILDILKTPTPDFALDIHKENNIHDLKIYLDVLTEREKEIIIYRYGLFDNDEITQKELAKKLNISRSYVSRIEKRALTKILREFLKHNKDI